MELYRYIVLEHTFDRWKKPYRGLAVDRVWQLTLLHREGWEVGRYPAYRQYREEGSALGQWHRRRRRAAEHLARKEEVRVLNRIKVQRGTPKTACCDTRREFSSKTMVPSAYQNGVRIGLCRPGKPTDNAFVESFNAAFRPLQHQASNRTHLVEEEQPIKHKDCAPGPGERRRTTRRTET